jgi:hypothetical protein
MKWFKKKAENTGEPTGVRMPAPVGASEIYKMRDAGDVKALLRIVGTPSSVEDAEEVDTAAHALAQLKDPRSLEPLLAVLKFTPYPMTREQAIDALGGFGDQRAVEPMVHVFERLVNMFREMILLLREYERDARGAPSLDGVMAAATAAGFDLRTYDPAWGYRSPGLQELLSGAVSAARMAITTAEALGKLGDARAAAPLAAVVNDDLLRESAESPRRAVGGDHFGAASYIAALPEMAAGMRAAAAKTLELIGTPIPEGPSAPAASGEVRADSGIAAVEGSVAAEMMMHLSAACPTCGASVEFGKGGLLAMDRGIRDQVIMCGSCNSIFEVDIGAQGMRLTTDVTARYKGSLDESRGSACWRCGASIELLQGGALAIERLGLDRVRNVPAKLVMCGSCSAIYEVEDHPEGIQLTAEVTSQYQV